MNTLRLLLAAVAMVWSTSLLLALSRHEPVLFTPSDNCVACHNNLTAASGEDVSIGAGWQGSMMANASRDPYFLASLRRETIDHPAVADDVQNECARCHAPAAQRTASAAGRQADVLSHVAARQAGRADRVDPLTTDGVTCTVCHQIDREGLGSPESFNGNFVLAPPLPSGNRRANGPHVPEPGRMRVMHSVTGFEQAEAGYMRESEVCATCHTLVTEARGPGGEVIGSLPEQMTYPEWRYSDVSRKQTCQACHMPPAVGPIRISSVLGLERETLARHTFPGGNAFMLRLLNRYRSQLGVVATAAGLDSAASATTRLLETATATLAIDSARRVGDSLAIEVVVTNLTGHKFPTGYPSRRAWLHLAVRDATGAIVFESGRLVDTGLIAGNDADADATMFETHHEEISRADQVQVYESVMGDRIGAPTTGLLKATRYLKDNRLLPAGFDKAAAGPDIRTVGGALGDLDFTGGGDRVRYRVPVAGTGPLAVSVELLFQPIGYRWARNLDDYAAREPQDFVAWFDSMAATSSTVIGRAQRTVH